MKQRKIVQWTAAYLAGAWLTLQVLDLLGNHFGWPPVVFRLAFSLLGVGLVAAVVLAWFHGERGRQRVGAVEAVLLIGIVVSGAGLAGYVVRRASGAQRLASPAAANEPAAPRNSVAVLPFADQSATRDQQYFAEGIAEEILDRLAMVQGLKVPARTSSFAFKRDDDVRLVGRRLGVATVLEGSVRRDGNQLRISAELVNARDGYILWSQKFDRQLSGIFAVQDQISKAILDTLRMKLTATAPSRTPTVQAHDLYLLGLFHWNRRTVPDLEQALSFFGQAIAADSGYALAWAGLANCYAVLPVYAHVSEAEAAAHGKAAARRALQIDPTLADAHAALGDIHFHYDRDWAAAEAEHRRALAINPRSSTARYWLWEVLAAERRLDAAGAEIARALELDPLSPRIHVSRGDDYDYRHDPQAAAGEYRAALELDPSFPTAQGRLALLLLRQSRTVEGAAALRRWGRLAALPPGPIDSLAAAIGDASRHAVTRALLARLGPSLPQGYLPALYTIAGDRDAALQALRADFAQHAHYIPFLAVDPTWDPLRPDPRFAAMVAALKLP